MDGTTTYTYNANGFTTCTTDALNGTVTTEYGTNGQPLRVIDATRRQTAYAYDDAGNLTSENRSGVDIDKRDELVRYYYDKANQLVKTNVEGKVTEYSYDVSGNLLSDGEATYTYDIQNRLLTKTNADGETTYEYDAAGNLVKETNPDGTVSYTYNAQNKLVKGELSDGQSSTYVYNALGVRIENEQEGKMGAWGWKLFQNDDACDIQDSYKEKLIVGQTDEEAEKSIIEEFELNRNLELWIPLAVAEWKVGRLGGRAKENALRGIEEELSDLENRWKPEYIIKRRDELLRVREQLQTEMPPKKKLRLPSWAWKCPWPVGSVLQYKLHYLKSDNTFANQYVLLLIQGISETPPGKIPCETIAVSLYNWIGTQAPADAKCEWNDPPKLIDFITKNGHRYETYSILLSKDQIRESEVKCIRNKPFLPEDYKASKASGANNVYFEEAAFLTLYK